MRKFLLRTSISALFLGLLIYLMRDNFTQILSVLKNIDRPLSLTAVLIFLSTVLVLAWRLRVIFIAEGIALKLSDAVNLTFIGYFFNNFLPTSVGGDIVKAMSAAQITGEPVKSVTCVLMDRIFGLFTFIIIPSVSLLFFLRDIKNVFVPIIVYSFLGASILCALLLFSKRVSARFKWAQRILERFAVGRSIFKVLRGLHEFRGRRRLMVQAMMLSVVGQSVNIYVLYLMAHALGSPAPLAYFYLLVPVVHLLSMVPSLNGLGVREWAYVYFLTPYLGQAYAFAIGILWFGLLAISSVIGGVIYLLRHDYHIGFKKRAGNLAEGQRSLT